MEFFKYQGAGNDFIVLDDRQAQLQFSPAEIAQLCHRRFGIGADGLMLLRAHPEYAFEMLYFNADGQPSSMCGNGGRCIAAFAHALGILDAEGTFLAVDGPHRVKMIATTWVELEMIPVKKVERGEDFFFLNTGSPHYVTYVPSLEDYPVVTAGRAIRYNERFAAVGTNVNFIEPLEVGIRLATYERGVEDETLACGTGATAAALAHHLQQGQGAGSYELAIEAKGGELQVRYRATEGGFEDIWLCGPAVQVFKGQLPAGVGFAE